MRLTRPARPSPARKKLKKPAVPGEPVDARLVVSRILSEDGEVLAEWLLMSNNMDMDASTLALWYYWRWQIECFFKEFKGLDERVRITGYEVDDEMDQEARLVFQIVED